MTALPCLPWPAAAPRTLALSLVLPEPGTPSAVAEQQAALVAALQQALPGAPSLLPQRCVGRAVAGLTVLN